jgi:hypothetical protein
MIGIGNVFCRQVVAIETWPILIAHKLALDNSIDPLT